MGIIYDTSKITDTKVILTRNPAKKDGLFLTQTPKNYVEDNYYLKTLQDKIDADWRFRPNRVDVEVEHEENWGKEKYDKLEVVVQSVKSDKGEVISDDWRRIVFRDLRYSCPIGTKFRIAPRYDNSIPDTEEGNKLKNIFLTVNHTVDVSPTSAVVIRRCNGTLGSVYTDIDGSMRYHYEPAIQEGISGTDLHYSEVANDPSAALTIRVQHNEYTKNYYINQRFIIGYDRAYRITNIDKFYSNMTYDPKNVGLLTLYLAIDELSDKDDLDKRIAYNSAKEDAAHIDQKEEDNKVVKIIEPNPYPNELTYEEMTIVAQVSSANGGSANEVLNLKLTLGDIEESMYSKYFTYTWDAGSNTLKIKKVRYCSSVLEIKFYVSETLYTSLSLSLAGLI